MNLLVTIIVNPILWAIWLELVNRNNNIEAFCFFFVGLAWGFFTWILSETEILPLDVENYSEVADEAVKSGSN